MTRIPSSTWEETIAGNHVTCRAASTTTFQATSTFQTTSTSESVTIPLRTSIAYCAMGQSWNRTGAGRRRAV